MTLQTPATGGIPADLEAKLWAAADKLRGHLDAAEYKNVVLRYVSRVMKQLG